MQKKYFLLVAFVMNFVQSAQPVEAIYGTDLVIGGANLGVYKKGQIDGKIIVGIVGLIVAGKIAYDVSWHSTYQTRVAQHYQDLLQYIQENDIQKADDEQFLNFASQAMRKDILFLETSLSDSYDSWLCPWNWTASQKTAHSNIQIVSILTLYADLVCEGSNLTEKTVAQYCRNMFVFTTMYPYVACHTKIQKHLDFIQSLVISQQDTKLHSMLLEMSCYLTRFKNILQGQKEYVDELQIMKTHALLQESINAQRAARRYYY